MVKKTILTLLIAATILTVPVYSAEFNLDKVRGDLKQLNHEWAENGWDNAAYGEQSDLTGLMEKYSYLTNNRELVDFVKKEFDKEKDPVEKRRLRLLYWDISGTYLFDEAAYIYDELYNHQAGDYYWVSFADDPVYSRDYYSLMRELEDSEQRKELWFADINYIVNTINPIHRERMGLEKELYPRLGYKSATEYRYEVLDLDKEKHRDLANAFLDKTFPMYSEVLTDRCDKVFGKTPNEVLPWDRGDIYFGKEYDKYFTKENSLPFTFGFLSDLGFDVQDNPNIHIDSEDRPEKEPRAATYTVSTPDDIRVNLKPEGGLADYESAFHEFGHALHFAYTDPNLPYEFRHLGTNEVTETYAFLLGRLFLNRNFLIEECGMPEAEVNDYLNHKLFTELGGAIYYAMLVLYEEKLHENVWGDDEAMSYYSDLRSKYSVWPREPYNDEAGYLTVDEEFYSINYMTAWYSEAQLRNKLEENYGERWYKDPAAGEFLKSLFVLGDSITVDELMVRIGYPQGLDAKYLINDFEEMYQVFKETSG